MLIALKIELYLLPRLVKNNIITLRDAQNHSAPKKN